MVKNLEAVDEAEHLRTDQNVVSARGDARVVGDARELVVQAAPERSMGTKINPTMILDEPVQSWNVLQVGVDIANDGLRAAWVAVKLCGNGLKEMFRIAGSSRVRMCARVAVAIREDACEVRADVECMKDRAPAIGRMLVLVSDGIDDHVGSRLRNERSNTTEIGIRGRITRTTLISQA